MSAFAPATHLIAHVSDTHLLGRGRNLFGTIDATATLERLLDRIRSSEIRPDALVFTGDLADIAEPEVYRWLRSRIEPLAAELGSKIVWAMGNHDERGAFARELFDSDDDGPQDRVYDVRGLRIIALDTSVPGYHHGELTGDQLDWLRDELRTPAEHGTVLAMHHPPVHSHNDFVRLIELRNMDALEPVVRGTDVRTILGGHLHYSTNALFAGVPVAVASATCYTLDLAPGAEFLASAVDGARSMQLVHFYPETVVHSIVPADEYPQVAGYPAGLREAVLAMTPEQLEEMVSNQSSPFNQDERSRSAES